MSAPAEGPELTQRLVLHLNMGSKGGSGTYAILADGVDTGIVREYQAKRGGQYVAHQLRKGDDVLDLMDRAQARGSMAWIRARLPQVAP